MPAQVITSDTILDEFDHHFRVFAGPGAGKTHWLTNHIKNVLKHSQHLSPSAYIACISYTNVAVNEIIERLGTSGDRVEVSTIHSFLYKNVVKPYIYLLKDEAGQDLVNHALVDGHDEHIPTYVNIEAWLIAKGSHRAVNQSFRENQDSWKKYLKKLRWQIDIDTDVYLPHSSNSGSYPRFFPFKQLDRSYKELYWKSGIIDHDDVLYFSSLILKKYPLIREFLSARYPYLFIDEFQDTNPVQTQMVKWLGTEHAKVGVIGDEEQAIYGFQGAKYQDFKNFSLPGHIEYYLEGNRRSTRNIIQLLNYMRGDGLKQTCIRGIEGKPVQCIIGPLEAAIPQITKSLQAGAELFILARTNDDVFSIRRQNNPGINSNLWDIFEQTDHERALFLEKLIIATESIRQKILPNGIKELIRQIAKSKGEVKSPVKCPHNLNENEIRGVAISLVEFIINQYTQIAQSSLLDLYQNLRCLLPTVLTELSLKSYKDGAPKTFAETTMYKDLAASIHLTEEVRTVRTIHQAKSTEFDNVLVCLKREKGHDQIIPILNPASITSEDSKEEKRIIYVALSRAKNNLYIHFPSLTPEEETQLKAQNLEIVRAT